MSLLAQSTHYHDKLVQILLRPLQAAYVTTYYPRQGGYVFVRFCVSLCAKYLKKLLTDFDETSRGGGAWPRKQSIRFRLDSFVDPGSFSILYH